MARKPPNEPINPADAICITCEEREVWVARAGEDGEIIVNTFELSELIERLRARYPREAFVILPMGPK